MLEGPQRLSYRGSVSVSWMEQWEDTGTQYSDETRQLQLIDAMTSFIATTGGVPG